MKPIRAWWLVAVLVVLVARVSSADPDPSPGNVTFTDVLNIPKVGVGVTSYSPYFWAWANDEEARRNSGGLISARPAASVALATKIYTVNDCTSAACTAGTGTPGALRCLTRVADDGSAWVVEVCTGTATLANNSVTPNNLQTTGQTDEFCLTFETGGTLEWQTCGGASGVTSLTCDASMTCTAVNPIVATGTISRAALTGDVTASAGSNATTIADNSVDGTDIAVGSDAQGDVLYYNGTDWVRLPAGTAGQVLHTQGPGANPQWNTDDTAGGGAVTGPGSSTDNAVVRWDGAGGTLTQNSPVIVSDGGDILLTNTGTAAQLQLREPSGAGTSIVGWVAPSLLAGDRVLVMPSDIPTTGEQLTYTGAGPPYQLSWEPDTATPLTDFSTITTGTNTNALTIGSGGSIAISGAGIVNANQVNCSTCVLNASTDLWPGMANYVPGSIEARNLMRFTDTFTMSPDGGATQTDHEFTVLGFTPLITSDPVGGGDDVRVSVIDVNPTANVNEQFSMIGMRVRGTYTTASTPGLTALQPFYIDLTSVSTTAGVAPYSTFGVNNAPTSRYTAASGTAAALPMTGFSDNALLENTGAGTLTGDITSFVSAPKVTRSAGVLTVGSRRGLQVNAPTITGTPTITEDVAVDVADTATAQTTAAMSLRSIGPSVSMRHVGKVRIGDATLPSRMVEILAPVAAAGVLELNMTGSATGGVRYIDMNNDQLLSIGAGGGFNGIVMGGAMDVVGAPTTLGTSAIFNDGLTLRNDSGNARTLTGTSTLAANPLFNANNATLTMNNNGVLGGAAAAAVSADPRWTRTSTPTGSTVAAYWTVVHGQAFADIAAGWTAGEYGGLKYLEPGGAGAIVNQYGVYVGPLAQATGATACISSGVPQACCTGAGTGPTCLGNVGIRNDDTTVYTPSTAQVLTVSTAILCNATTVQITAAAAIGPLTSNPQIADGADGQICIIVNVDTTDTITLEGTGTNVRFPGGVDIALAAGESITVMFNATLADWTLIARGDT